MANLMLIRQLCKERSITVRELARRINRDESSIQSAMRRGSSNTATIERIAQVLGVSAGIFFENYDGGSMHALQQEVIYLRKLIKEKERLIVVKDQLIDSNDKLIESQASLIEKQQREINAMKNP